MNPGIAIPTRRALRFLSLAYFIQATGALALIGCLAVVAQEWRLSEQQSAYLISAFGITFAICAPALQVLFGHLPRRKQVLLGLSIFSASAVLFALATSFNELLLARVAMGLGAALIGPVLTALGSSLVESKEQGSAVAIVLLGLSFSGVVGMPFAASIANTWGPRVLFMLVGVLGLSIALLIRRFVPDSGAGHKVKFKTLQMLLLDAAMLPALLVVFFLASAVFSTYAFLTPIIRDIFKGGPDVVTAALLVLGVAGIVGNIFVVKAARHFSSEQMLYAGAAGLALILLLVVVSPHHLTLLFIALVGWAFCTDVIWPTQQRRIIELRPEQRSIGLALTASFLFSGIGFGSALAGWVYTHFSAVGNVSASLILLGLSMICLRISIRAKKREVLPETKTVH